MQSDAHTTRAALDEHGDKVQGPRILGSARRAQCLAHSQFKLICALPHAAFEGRILKRNNGNAAPLPPLKGSAKGADIAGWGDMQSQHAARDTGLLFRLFLCVTGGAALGQLGAMADG